MKQVLSVIILLLLISCKNESRLVITENEPTVYIEAVTVFNEGVNDRIPFTQEKSYEILENYDNVSGWDTEIAKFYTKENYLRECLRTNEFYDYQIKIDSITLPCILMKSREGSNSNSMVRVKTMRIFTLKQANLGQPLLLLDYSSTSDGLGSGYRNSILKFYKNNCLILKFNNEVNTLDIIYEDGTHPGKTDHLTIIAKILSDGTIKVIESYWK